MGGRFKNKNLDLGCPYHLSYQGVKVRCGLETLRTYKRPPGYCNNWPKVCWGGFHCEIKDPSSSYEILGPAI